MKVFVSLSKSKNPDLTSTAQLIYDLVMTDSARARAPLAKRIAELNLDSRFKTSGTVYRQILVSQTAGEKILNAKEEEEALKVKPTPISSWTSSLNAADKFANENFNDTSKSRVILKMDLKKKDCLVYIPNFVKNAKLTDKQWLEIAKGNKQELGLFMRRSSEAGEAEAIVANNVLSFKKSQIVHLDHRSKAQDDVLKKIEKEFGAKVSKSQVDSSVSLKSGKKSIEGYVKSSKFIGTISYDGTSKNLKPFYTFDVDASYEVIRSLFMWITTKTTSPPPYAVEKKAGSGPIYSKIPKALQMRMQARRKAQGK
jgi:hypothetical protein